MTSSTATRPMRAPGHPVPREGRCPPRARLRPLPEIIVLHVAVALRRVEGACAAQRPERHRLVEGHGMLQRYPTRLGSTAHIGVVSASSDPALSAVAPPARPGPAPGPARTRLGRRPPHAATPEIAEA